MKILSLGHPAITHPAPGSVLTISLHGFPGVKSQQNREIAEIVVEETGGPVDVLLYRGLGYSPGEFSFAECIEDVRAHASQRLSEGWSRLNLIGHSWGGFLALLIASELGAVIDHLVLISPLLKFAVGQNETLPFFEEKARENPSLAIQDSIRLVREFEEVGREKSTDEMIERIPQSVKVLLLQAKGDEVTPEAYAHTASKLFRPLPTFEVVETDHSFVLNRPAISKRIAAFLKT